jgi:hypothetical protein
MRVRRFSRFAIGTAALALTLTAVLLFSGSATSAGGGQQKGPKAKPSPTPTGDRTAPTTPTNLVVTAVTKTSVSLSWQPSTDNAGTFSYTVRVNNLQTSSVLSATVDGSATTYTPSFLSPNTPYSFIVYAVDGNLNRSGDSNVANANTLADTTPPTTPVLEASVLGPSQVKLTWTKSTDDLPLRCCLHSFEMNGAPLTQHINAASAPAGKLAVIIRHLTPGSTNTFVVKVGDFSGNFVSSNSATASCEPSSDTTPPTAPTNLHLIRDDTNGEVWIGWTEATDETDSQDEIEYEIYVDGVLSPLPVSAGVNFDFVYGNSNTDNVFTVKAVDRSGNTSAASAPLKLFLQ